MIFGLAMLGFVALSIVGGILQQVDKRRRWKTIRAYEDAFRAASGWTLQRVDFDMWNLPTLAVFGDAAASDGFATLMLDQRSRPREVPDALARLLAEARASGPPKVGSRP